MKINNFGYNGNTLIRPLSSLLAMPLIAMEIVLCFSVSSTENSDSLLKLTSTCTQSFTTCSGQLF